MAKAEQNKVDPEAKEAPAEAEATQRKGRQGKGGKGRGECKGQRKHWKHWAHHGRWGEQGSPWDRPIIIVIPPGAVNLAGRFFGGGKRRFMGGKAHPHGKCGNGRHRRGDKQAADGAEAGKEEGKENEEGILIDPEQGADDAGDHEEFSSDNLPPWVRGILPYLHDGNDEGGAPENEDGENAPDENNNPPPHGRRGGRRGSMPFWLRNMIRQGIRMYGGRGRGRRGFRRNHRNTEEDALQEQVNDQELSQDELLAMYENRAAGNTGKDDKQDQGKEQQ